MGHTTASRNPTIEEYLRSGGAIAVFLMVFVLATPMVLILLLVSLGRLTNWIIATIPPLMMKPVLWTAGISFRVAEHRGASLQHHQPVVYIVNHGSTLDLVAILALGLPRVRFVAKWELQYNPFFYVLGNATGQVFIKRRNSAKAVETLQQAYRRLQDGRLSVLLAPEGSRKHPGVIGPFKKGPFRMAMDLGYPIVPIYFEGNRQLSSGGSLLFRKGTITAHIHAPVDVSDWKLDTLDDEIALVRERYLQWAGVME